jgi:hypothetical protein
VWLDFVSVLLCLIMTCFGWYVMVVNGMGWWYVLKNIKLCVYFLMVVNGDNNHVVMACEGGIWFGMFPYYG